MVWRLTIKLLNTMAVVLLGLVAAVPISAETGQSTAAAVSDRLRQFQQLTQSMHGQFRQRIIENSGLADEEPRSGDFWVERPDKIRWHYRQPYEQLIVADGFKVWLYDPDLDQVLVRDLAPDGDDVAGLLLGSSDDIARRFTVTPISEDQYLLVPLTEESAIEQVVIRFEQQLMVSLQVRDVLGVTSEFEFIDLQANTPIDPEQFHFVPPDGVDVVIQ